MFTVECFEFHETMNFMEMKWINENKDEAFQLMNKQKDLLNTIKGRKMQYLGHVLRGER